MATSTAEPPAAGAPAKSYYKDEPISVSRNYDLAGMREDVDSVSRIRPTYNWVGAGKLSIADRHSMMQEELVRQKAELEIQADKSNILRNTLESKLAIRRAEIEEGERKQYDEVIEAMTNADDPYKAAMEGVTRYPDNKMINQMVVFNDEHKLWGKDLDLREMADLLQRKLGESTINKYETEDNKGVASAYFMLDNMRRAGMKLPENTDQDALVKALSKSGFEMKSFAGVAYLLEDMKKNSWVGDEFNAAVEKINSGKEEDSKLGIARIRALIETGNVLSRRGDEMNALRLRTQQIRNAQIKVSLKEKEHKTLKEDLATLEGKALYKDPVTSVRRAGTYDELVTGKYKDTISTIDKQWEAWGGHVDVKDGEKVYTQNGVVRTGQEVMESIFNEYNRKIRAMDNEVNQLRKEAADTASLPLPGISGAGYDPDNTGGGTPDIDAELDKIFE